MYRLSNGAKSILLLLFSIISFISIQQVGLANDPIASIGNPRPEKFAFIDDNTIVQVVPTHFQIVNTDTGNIIDEFGRITAFYDVWFSEDGSHIVNVDYSRDTKEYTINVWDANKREIINGWKIENRLSHVALSATQPVLAAAQDDEISIWNWQTGEKIGKMIGERLPTERCNISTCRSPPRTFDMVFSQDGQFLFVGSMRPKIEIWHVESRQLVGYVGEHIGNWVEGIEISPDGKLIASIEKALARVYVWSLETKKLIWTEKNGNDYISEIEFSPDSQHLYVATHTVGLRKIGTDPWTGWDDTVRIWDAKLGQLIDAFNTEFKYLSTIELSPNGKTILLKYNDAVVLYDISQNSIISEWSNFINSRFGEVELSPAGETVVAVSAAYIKTWDVDSEQMKLLISAQDYEFDGLAISPDSKLFAVGKDPFLEIRDIRTGRVVTTFEHRISSPRYISYSPTGQRIGVLPLRREILVLNTKNPKFVQRLEIGLGIENPSYNGIAFSESDKYLAVTCYSYVDHIKKNYLLLWKRNNNTFTLQSEIKLPEGYFAPVFTTLGETTLVAVSDRNETMIFKLLNKGIQQISVLDASYTVQFTQDSRYLLSNDDDNFQIWDWNRNRKINHQQYPYVISLSKSGSAILSYNENGQYQVWDISHLVSNLPYAVDPIDKKYVTLGSIKLNQLLQNYPNPFNPETWIPFKLAEDSEVSIDIFNSTGVLIRSISQGTMKAGDHSSQSKAIHWDGKNNNGEPVSSGVYFYTINAGNFTATRKMMITK